MVSRERRKLQKRKAKEAENRKKLLFERERRTVERKAASAQEKQQKEIRKAHREKDELEAWADNFVENLPKLPEQTRKQIEHNILVLKALEEEYAAEMKAKQEIGDKLSSEGCETLEQKLKVLEEKVCIQTEELEPTQIKAEVKQDVGIGGGADYSFTPTINKENSESH